MTSPKISLTSWPAPAKLNLFLHITGQREDGLHCLQTIFQILDICDTLQFEITDDGVVSRLTESDIPQDEDLIVKAARLLQSHAGVSQGVSIYIDKQLPIGGGLGGGSSNAATTLVALNHLWGCGLSIDDLASLGVQLGADVPIFVRGISAWAEGIGEQISAINLPKSHYVVIFPQIFVSTGKVFAHSQLRRDCTTITIRDFSEVLDNLGYETAFRRVENVCEPVVRDMVPEVDAALKDLAEFADARLTGTGACVFARFDSEVAARQAWQVLNKKWTAFLAQGVNRSALYDVLESQSSC